MPFLSLSPLSLKQKNHVSSFHKSNQKYAQLSCSFSHPKPKSRWFFFATNSFILLRDIPLLLINMENEWCYKNWFYSVIFAAILFPLLEFIIQIRKDNVMIMTRKVRLSGLFPPLYGCHRCVRNLGHAPKLCSTHDLLCVTKKGCFLRDFFRKFCSHPLRPNLPKLIFFGGQGGRLFAPPPREFSTGLLGARWLAGEGRDIACEEKSDPKRPGVPGQISNRISCSDWV